jgi:prepilin-type N-terminal cleavage/methylation domain-containing protein
MHRSIHARSNARHDRGFTLAELLIVLSAALITATFLFFFFAGFNGSPTATSAMFDETAAASAWAESLDYEVKAVNCANMPEQSRFVRCTVRVEEQSEPFALECSLVSKSCGLMPAARR